MQVDDGLASLGRQQEAAILLVIHEQILSENRRAKRVLEYIECRLDIWVTIDWRSIGIGLEAPSGAH